MDESPRPGLFQYSIGSLLVATTCVAVFAALVRFLGSPVLLLLPSIAGALMFYYGDRGRSGSVRIDNTLKVLGLLIFLSAPVLCLVFLPLLHLLAEY